MSGWLKLILCIQGGVMLLSILVAMYGLGSKRSDWDSFTSPALNIFGVCWALFAVEAFIGLMIFVWQ